MEEDIVINVEINTAKSDAGVKALGTSVTKTGDAVKNTKGNVAGFSTALDKAVPGLGSAATGMMGMVKASLAFIATPIGAIMAALAVIIGVVVEALKRSEPVLDFFENLIGGATAAIDFLIANLKSVGTILVAVFTGDVNGAMKGLGMLAGGMNEAAKAAIALMEAQRQLTDEQNMFTISSASAEKQIKALIIASKNKALSYDEQKEKILEAIEAEKELTDKREEFAKREEKIQIQQMAAKKGERQLDDETWDMYVERLITGNILSEEDAKKAAELSRARIQASSDSLVFEEKTSNMLTAIDEKRIAEYDKQIEAAKKKTEKLAEEAVKVFETEQAFDLARSEQAEETADKNLQDLQDFMERENELEKQLQEEKIEIYEDATEEIQKTEMKSFKARANQWMAAHAEEIEAMSKKIATVANMVSGFANSVTQAILGSLRLQEQALTQSVAKEKALLVDAHKAEIAELDKKLKAGLISKDTYDKLVLESNAKFQTETKRLEIEAAKKLNELKRKEFEVNKQNSIIQAIADGAKAVLSTFANTPGGFIIKGIAAALAAAFAVIQIAQIRKTEFVPMAFAKSGKVLSGKRISSTDGIAINRNNGDNLLATVRTNEVILNERHQAMLGGNRTFSRIGVPGFADSGHTGGSSVASVVDNKELIDAIREMKIVLIREEYELGKELIDNLKYKSIVIS